MYDYGSFDPSFRNLRNIGTANQVTNFFYAKVAYVILSTNDEYYEDERSIGSILFSTLYNTEGSLNNISKAYPYSISIKDIPLVNEIVRIDIAPGVNIDANFQDVDYYYTRCVDLFNVVNNNIQKTRNKSYTDSENFRDLSDIVKPLLPNTGDFILQGRLGQSLRMGGYLTSGNTPFITSENNANPFIIISNGGRIDDNSSFSLEDINKDSSSIYLTSNHILDLQAANTSRRAYINNPVDINTYKGKQVGISSDRIVLNAKEDDILLSSKNSIGLNSDSVNLEGKNYVSLEASEIFLGQEALLLPNEDKEPAVLGLQNKQTLQLILSQLEELAETFINIPSNTAGISASLISAGLVLQAQNLLIRELLEKINSKKIFIDSGKI